MFMYVMVYVPVTSKKHGRGPERERLYCGRGGMGGTGGSACRCEGRCSLRFCASRDWASRSACILFMAKSCCAMKSDVPGLHTMIRNVRQQITWWGWNDGGTDLIRRIRKIVSPFETSFSCCFSFLRFLMVPRFRCWYTLLARFLTEGDARRLCCIIRTHSSMRASLQNVADQRATLMNSVEDRRTYASRSRGGWRGRRDTSDFAMFQRVHLHPRRRNSFAGTSKNLSIPKNAEAS